MSHQTEEIVTDEESDEELTAIQNVAFQKGYDMKYEQFIEEGYSFPAPVFFYNVISRPFKPFFIFFCFLRQIQISNVSIR